MDSNFKTVASVRDTVTAWGCGGHRRHMAGGKRPSKHKLAASKQKGSKDPAEDAAGTGSALKGTETEGAPADAAPPAKAAAQATTD
jgi:D-alanyl-D-alanine carboxypeptidase